MRILLTILLLGLWLPRAGARVVINEIFYNAPGDIGPLEWVELLNTGEAAVDLSGWKLTRGMEVEFAKGTTIPAGGYLVLARNAELFKEHYGFAPAQTFKDGLSRKSMRLDLVDAGGKAVDSARYKDESPWPLGADGYSASLERICPTADGTKGASWTASPLPEEMKPAGTPGQRNASYSATLPPIISKVKFNPTNPEPGQTVTVEAEVSDSTGVKEVACRYRVALSGEEQAESTIAMSKTGERQYRVQIPGQKENQLVRFRIHAVNEQGASRFWPGENEPRPTVSYFVAGKVEKTPLPQAWIINVDAEQVKAFSTHLRSPHQRGFNEDDQARMMARRQLESGLDLAPVWVDLTTSATLQSEQLASLRAVFTNQMAKRDELIKEVADAPDVSVVKEKSKMIPDLVKSFQTNVSAAAKLILTDEQHGQFQEAQKRQSELRPGPGRPYTPEMALKQVMRLEPTFFRLTTRADLTEAQFRQVAEIYREGFRQRLGLTNVVQALMQGQGDFEDLREKMDQIYERVAQKLKPVLTVEQNRDFAKWRKEIESFMPGQGRTRPPRRPQGRSAFVYLDPAKGEPEVYDFVTVAERNSGLNLHFHKDRLFHGMSTINALYEYNDRFILAEPLAYELYRRVGNAASLTEFVRLAVDGVPLGFYVVVEQPNRTFLERNRLKGEGNLYKLLWYERGVVGQHEKKTNRQSGHDDIVALVDQLEKTKEQPDEQWAVIKKNFNLEQVVNYFAVNTVLSHWDGFFNNYFTYHDVGGTDKWEMYPWDQDKTWGFYDSLPENEVFFDMPLTFGMEGDRPPGWPKDRPPPRGFGMGPRWWRPGGFFSKPLLANPHFRKLYLARTKEILETVYTEQVFFPIIDNLGTKLRADVRARAVLLKQDPDQAVEKLQQNLQSLKDHLTKRRNFLLEQEEIRSAGQQARVELHGE